MTEYLPAVGVLEQHKDERVSEYTITWGELRTAWERLFIDKSHTLKTNGGHHTIVDFQSDSGRRDGWKGFSNKEAHDWLKDGYKPGLNMLNIEAPMQRERRRIRTAEEGEYQHDAALSGFDYPFLAWDIRPGKRGIRVLYNIALSSGTPADAVNKYIEWCAEFSHSLEYADLDYSLGFVCKVTSLGSKYSTSRINILVKSEDEAASFSSWSSMLSPASFRGYMFVAMVLACEQEGKHASSYLGQPIGARGFTVNIEHDTETIVIDKPASFTAASVNKEELTRKAKTLLENPLDADELVGA